MKTELMYMWAAEAAPHRSLVNNPKSVCECKWRRIDIHISNCMKKGGTGIAKLDFPVKY